MHHAVRLVAAVREQLGPRATLDGKRPAGEPAVVLRDEVLSDWVVPIPLLDVVVAGGSVSTTMTMFVAAPPGAKTAPPAVAPDIMPTGPEMRAGSLTIREGAASFAIEYGRFSSKAASA